MTDKQRIRKLVKSLRQQAGDDGASVILSFVIESLNWFSRGAEDKLSVGSLSMEINGGFKTSLDLATMKLSHEGGK